MSDQQETIGNPGASTSTGATKANPIDYANMLENIDENSLHPNSILRMPDAIEVDPNIISVDRFTPEALEEESTLQFFGEFMDNFNKHREELKKNWDRKKKLSKLLSYLSSDLKDLPSSPDEKKAFEEKFGFELKNYGSLPFFPDSYAIYRYKPIYGLGNDNNNCKFTYHEKWLKAVENLCKRSDEELNALLDCLMDYEILCHLFTGIKAATKGKGSVHTTTLRALEKINFALNLSQLSQSEISGITLITILYNIHILDKRFFICTPNMKEAFNNFLWYALTRLKYSISHIQFLIQVFRAFAYFLDRYQMLAPGVNADPEISQIDPQWYRVYFINWYTQCRLPQYTKCLKNYNASDVVGFKFLKDMHKILIKEFKLAYSKYVEGIAIDDFAKTFELFLDDTKPFWGIPEYEKESEQANFILRIQELLLDSYSEYIPSNDGKKIERYHNLNEENAKKLLLLHEEILRLKPTTFKGIFECEINDDQNSSDVEMKDVSENNHQQPTQLQTEQNENEVNMENPCVFCDYDNCYCYIHDRVNKNVNELEFSLDKVLPRTIENKYLCLKLFKIDNEYITFPFLTDLFDPKNFNMKTCVDYYFRLPIQPQYLQLAINEPLLMKQQSTLLNYLMESKPPSQFRQLLHSIFLQIVDEQSNTDCKIAKLIKEGPCQYSIFRPIKFNYMEIMSKFLSTRFRKEEMKKISKHLVGETPNYDDQPRLPENRVEFFVLDNSKMASWSDECKLWMVDLQNVYSEQLPRMEKNFIVRLTFDPRHITLMLIKDNKQVIGGMTFRIFSEGNFSEIVFCAVKSIEQVKGYGTRMMNYMKDYHMSIKIYNFLTYADEYAVGFFEKQGFSEEIEIPEELYKGFLKEYDGALLMQCKLQRGIFYCALDQALKTQTRIVDKITNYKVKQHEQVFKFNFEQKTIVSRSFLEDMFKSVKMRPNISLLDFTDHSAELLPKLSLLLDDIENHSSAKPFLQLVDEATPRYYDIIRFPIAISVIRERINNNYYTNMHLFKADINRMLQNSRNFCPKGSYEAECADLLESFIIAKMRQMELLD